MDDEDNLGSTKWETGRQSAWNWKILQKPALRKFLLPALSAFLVLALLYYPVGALWVEEIDDNVPTIPAPSNGGSAAVNVAIELLNRELNQHRWVSNDPFFFPGALLDNMPNFQQGIIQAIWRFSLEMTDQIGRVRGSSAADADLEQATGLLKYPADIWLWRPSISLMPIASSESQYRTALRALTRYNARLANNAATFEARGDNLLAVLDRIASDLGSSSAQLDQHIADRSSRWFDTEADDIFFHIKGSLYAYGLLLKGLGEDFRTIIQERDMQTAWDQTVDSLLKGATIHPLFVMNGAPDSVLIPNHLAIEGFYLLRARTQLRELTNILQK